MCAGLEELPLCSPALGPPASAATLRAPQLWTAPPRVPSWGQSPTQLPEPRPDGSGSTPGPALLSQSLELSEFLTPATCRLGDVTR